MATGCNRDGMLLACGAAAVGLFACNGNIPAALACFVMLAIIAVKSCLFINPLSE